MNQLELDPELELPLVFRPLLVPLFPLVFRPSPL
jgi:hypothetical protein